MSPHRGLQAVVAICAAASVAIPSGPAQAWGDDGHKIVAALAWDLMSAQTQNRIADLLKDDPDTLVKIPAGQDHSPKAVFVALAVWADRFRDYDRAPDGQQNTFAANPQYMGTNKWHFADVEYGPNGHPDQAKLDAACFNHPALQGSVAGYQKATAQANANACNIDKIKQFEAELASPNIAKAERVMALKFLIHLVGDMHQPLHDADNHDGGGNCVTISGGAAGASYKLHSYWDTPMVKKVEAGQDFMVAAATLKTGLPANYATWRSGSLESWALATSTIADNDAYALHATTLPSCSHQGSPIPLPPGYESQAIKDVRDQLSRAGVRLAGVLTQALG
jgi:hypothetical protein